MTATTPNATMRRATSSQRPVQSPVHAATVGSFDDDAEFRLDLSDIPRMRWSLHVDGLKPTLLSRLFDLVAPLKP
jgi:hypothetical protein